MNSQQPESAVRPYRGIAFVAVQVLFAAAAIGAIGSRLQEAENRRRLPPLRRTPVKVRPQYDYPWIISDDQLATVLFKLRPRLRGPKPKINHVDHALRFWGAEAAFGDPDCLSGREMRDMLVSHGRFVEAWGPETKPLLIPHPAGTRVRTKQGSATASHVDHTLAGLAEVGTPLDFPTETPAGMSTVRSILEGSLRSFSLNQLEYEWSALAYALYLQPVQPWTSSEGQQITFDRLARRIMRQRLSQGVCYGNHRLHALVILLRVDEQHSILSPECRARIIRHLRGATSALALSQAPSGYWNQHWAEGTPPSEDQPPGKLDPLSSRLLATGHALEWMALAPEEVHPPREVLVSAGRWLSQTITGMDDEKIKQNYTFLSHAGSALALWRGHLPAEVLGSIHAGHRANCTP